MYFGTYFLFLAQTKATTNRARLRHAIWKILKKKRANHLLDKIVDISLGTLFLPVWVFTANTALAVKSAGGRLCRRFIFWPLLGTALTCSTRALYTGAGKRVLAICFSVDVAP